MGPGIYLFVLTNAADAMNQILLAANNTFDPAEKRELETVVPSLDLKPRDYVRRLTHILEGPFSYGKALDRAGLFKELANEVLWIAGQTSVDD